MQDLSGLIINDLDGAVAIAGPDLGSVMIVAVVIGLSSQSNEVGMGIPTENLVQRPGTDMADIDGYVDVAGNGCFHLDSDEGERYFVVWPEGSRQDAPTVLSPTAVYGDGDPIHGRGWVRDVDDVVAAADGKDGYMDMVLGYCAAEGEKVAVIKIVPTS